MINICNLFRIHDTHLVYFPMIQTLFSNALMLSLTVIGACIIGLAFDIPDRYIAEDELDVPFTIKLLITVAIVVFATAMVEFTQR